MDAIHYKIREDHQVMTKAAYVVLGLNNERMKEVLGLWSRSQCCLLYTSSKGASTTKTIKVTVKNKKFKTDISKAGTDKSNKGTSSVETGDRTNICLLYTSNIQTIRKYRGMKQQELADKIGINMQSLSKIERGLNYPAYDTLEKIMDVLGVTPNELLSGEWKYVNQAEKEV